MSFIIHLRQECSREAFQLWLDAKGEQKFKVVAVRVSAPCSIEIDVEDIKEVVA